MRVVLLRPEAKADLRSIRTYTIRAWSKPQAKRYLAVLKRHFADLAQAPLLHPQVEGRRDSIRKSHLGRHLIIYLPIESGVEIVRVLHERMDIAARLSEL